MRSANTAITAILNSKAPFVRTDLYTFGLTNGTTLRYAEWDANPYPPTNLLPRSQEFDKLPWYCRSDVTPCTVTPNAAAAPDGTTTADLITYIAGTGSFYQDAPASGTSTLTMSLFVKGGTAASISPTLWWHIGGVDQHVQLTMNPITGAFISTEIIGGAQLVGYTITAVGGGWYRLTLRGTGTDAANTQIRYEVYAPGSVTLYVWGAQVDQSWPAGPYLATTTAPIQGYSYDGNGPVFQRQNVSHKVGLDVDECRIRVSPRSTDLIGSVPWLQAVRAGMLDGATFSLDFSISGQASTTPILAPNAITEPPWGMAGAWCAKTANVTAAPDGTVTADLFAENATSSNTYDLWHPLTVTPGSAVRFSVYLKAQTRSAARVSIGNSLLVSSVYVDVNLSNGTLSTIGITGSGGGPLLRHKPMATITTAGNGWYLVTVSGRPSEFDSTVFADVMLESVLGSVAPYAGTVGAGVYVWGASVDLVAPVFLATAGTVNWFSGKVSAIDNISRSGCEIVAKSDIERLQIQLPRNLYQPGCLNTLYDAGCKVAPAGFTYAGAVNVVNSNTSFSITGAAVGQSTGWFDQGWLKFTSGVNTGLVFSVKQWTGSAILLYVPMVNLPSNGDTFTIYAGCDKGLTTCVNKFNNKVNFRGFPFIPAPEVVG
jgi:hypothetical protein